MMASRKRYDFLKRAIDVIGAGTLLIVTAPIQAVVAVSIKLKLGSPVLFRQERPGKNENIFELVKFRSMREPDEKHVTDEQRLVPFGKFLRSTSIDELPTLWNVLKGEMSLVGPRPLRTYYLDRYSDHHRRRHEVRPGVTGLAQISGRNAISWSDRFDLDVEYVDNRSLALDMKILFKTVTTSLGRQGISAEGHATMPPFTGYEETSND